MPSVGDSENMEAVQFTPQEPLEGDKFGVPTPRSVVIEKDLVDVCIAPGLAFSPVGDRLGYGKGYYDRFFARRQVGLAIGLCFECQIVPQVPVDQFDHPMDWVLTEEQVSRHADRPIGDVEKSAAFRRFVINRWRVWLPRGLSIFRYRNTDRTRKGVVEA